MKIIESILTQIGMRNETQMENIFLEDASDTTELVKQRAYELWEQNGRPESDGVEFWLQAEKEIHH
jgi:hypothetical protein